MIISVVGDTDHELAMYCMDGSKSQTPGVARKKAHTVMACQVPTNGFFAEKHDGPGPDGATILIAAAEGTMLLGDVLAVIASIVGATVQQEGKSDHSRSDR